MGRYQSGQMEQTVNLSARAFAGSNPALPTIVFKNCLAIFFVVCIIFLKHLTSCFMKTKFFIMGFLSAVAILSLSSVVSAGREYSRSFNDVKEDEWYYSAVMELSEEGLLSGYSDGSFGVGRNITREEAAKLFYLTNLRISKLEAKLSGSSVVDEEDDSNDESVSESEEEENVSDDANDEEEQIVLHITNDLNAVASLPSGYSVFEETLKKFKVFYPSVYFWNNSIGESKKAQGYLWYVEFSKDDFSTEEDPEVNFVVSIVEPSKINSDREVLIFVKRDDTTSFLVEGDLEDMKDLQKIAVSFKNIQ